MERDGQDIIFLIQLKKLCPPQRSAGEVEWNARMLRKETCEPVCSCPQITIDQRKVHLHVDDLYRISILQLKSGAQCFVAKSDLIQRADQRAAIESAFKPDGNWDVVCRRGAKLLQKPEPALSERERYRLRLLKSLHFWPRALGLRSLYALGKPTERTCFEKRSQC